jgi:hypothetical protein
LVFAQSAPNTEYSLSEVVEIFEENPLRVAFFLLGIARFSVILVAVLGRTVIPQSFPFPANNDGTMLDASCRFRV